MNYHSHMPTTIPTRVDKASFAAELALKPSLAVNIETLGGPYLGSSFGLQSTLMYQEEQSPCNAEGGAGLSTSMSLVERVTLGAVFHIMAFGKLLFEKSAGPRPIFTRAQPLLSHCLAIPQLPPPIAAPIVVGVGYAATVPMDSNDPMCQPPNALSTVDVAFQVADHEKGYWIGVTNSRYVLPNTTTDNGTLVGVVDCMVQQAFSTVNVPGSTTFRLSPDLGAYKDVAYSNCSIDGYNPPLFSGMAQYQDGNDTLVVMPQGGCMQKTSLSRKSSSLVRPPMSWDAMKKSPHHAHADKPAQHQRHTIQHVPMH